MGQFLIGLIGIAFAYLMIRYREQVGDSLGNAEWMKFVGGPYNFAMILGVIIFFWSVSYMTGTTDIFFFPITLLFGGMFQQ